MDELESRRDDLLGTTDYLEAVTVLRGAKNFMFVVTLLAMLIFIGVFVLAQSKYTIWEEPPAAEGGEAGQVEVPMDAGQPAGSSLGRRIQGLAMLAAVAQDLPDEAGAADEAVEGTEGQAADPELEIQARVALGQADAAAEDQEYEQAGPRWEFQVKFVWLEWLLRITGFVSVLTASLYVLVVIFTLKISLVGRLGGINHIARAFILALLALVIILPWQQYFAPVLVGAIYTPGELKAALGKDSGDIVEMALMYLRFAGLPLLALILLIMAQVRTGRWGRATLKRLEVI